MRKFISIFFILSTIIACSNPMDIEIIHPNKNSTSKEVATEYIQSIINDDLGRAIGAMSIANNMDPLTKMEVITELTKQNLAFNSYGKNVKFEIVHSEEWNNGNVLFIYNIYVTQGKTVMYSVVLSQEKDGWRVQTIDIRGA